MALPTSWASWGVGSKTIAEWVSHTCRVPYSLEVNLVRAGIAGVADHNKLIHMGVIDAEGLHVEGRHSGQVREDKRLERVKRTVSTAVEAVLA